MIYWQIGAILGGVLSIVMLGLYLQALTEKRRLMQSLIASQESMTQSTNFDGITGLPGSTVKCKRPLIHIGLRLCRATTRGSTGLEGSVF
jgi:hypothetical protein